jgi:hypothetical protein
MTKEFKEIIAPFLFEGKEYCPQFCSFVDGWPEITIQDQWHRPEKQKISNENVTVVHETDNSIWITAGNQYQGNFLIVITELDGKAIVESCEKVYVDEEGRPTNYALLPRLSEEKLIGMFHDVKIGERIYTKSAAVWQMELNIALKNEDYNKAAEIRDAMQKAGVRIGKTAQ